MTDVLYFTEIIRLFIGMVLIAAAWGKTKTYHQFTASLVDSFYLPVKISKLFAPLLIMLEWGLAFVILTKVIEVQVAMVASLVLFIVFTCVVLLLLFKHGVVKCNCFGEQQRPISMLDLVRNFLFIFAIAFYLAFAEPAAVLGYDILFLLTGIAAIVTVLTVHFHDLVSVLNKSYRE